MPHRIVGIGEILWDLLPSGAQLGGAPANFSYHASALGADACVISRIGMDSLGDGILGRFSDLQLNTECLQRDATRGLFEARTVGAQVYRIRLRPAHSIGELSVEEIVE